MWLGTLAQARGQYKMLQRGIGSERGDVDFDRLAGSLQRLLHGGTVRETPWHGRDFY